MPESTCLHIQDRGSGSIRVVEFPWISVRIGAAGFCEVRSRRRRFTRPSMSVTRRRTKWQLLPLDSRGLLLVRDEPVHIACSLPFDLPFQIGSGVPDVATDPVSES